MSLPPLLPTNYKADPIAAATRAIRNYCGWHVAPVIEETMILDGNGAEVLQLRSGKVVEVREVTVDGNPVEVEWSEDGLLRLKGGGRWPKKYRAIEVDIMHGHEAAEDLAQLITGLQARAAMDPTGVITHQRAGTQGVNTSPTGGAISLLDREKAILDAYRLVWGP